MRIEHVVRMITVMRRSPQQAMTKTEIWTRWRERYATDDRPISLRTIERYVSAMASGGGGMEQLAIEVQRPEERATRYYLDSSKVARLLMPEDIALQMVLTRPLVEGLIDRIGVGDNFAFAEAVTQELTGSSRELRRRVRVVPDGIGRRPARIDGDVLTALVAAIASRRCLAFEYRSAQGNLSCHEVTVLGLILKDGTQYMIAVTGFSDRPRHYAVHRIARAEASATPAAERRDFDLDEYIHQTHQLSHPLNNDSDDIELRLEVAPEAIYHLRERPLTEEQEILEPQAQGDWYQVRARIPNTLLLIPWLLSMGGWVAVVAPESVRTEIATRVAAMAALYRDTPAA